MLSPCLTERAGALVNAESIERHQSLLHKIQQLRGDMNARGMLTSSQHVNEACNACESELRERAKIIWQCIQRAHKSCGAGTSEDLPTLFRGLLQGEKIKLEQMQEEATGNIVRQLQNTSLIQLQLVSATYDNLIVQYDAEIAMYIDNIKRGIGANFYERLKSAFLNNKLIAAIVLVVAVIILLASFTDAISKLSTFIGNVVGGK